MRFLSNDLDEIPTRSLTTEALDTFAAEKVCDFLPISRRSSEKIRMRSYSYYRTLIGSHCDILNCDISDDFE